MPLLLIFLAIAAAEIAVFIELGGVIGLWPTLGSIFATAILGGAILRHQGLSTLARARRQIERGQLPVAEMLDGVALVVTALLLLTPGFITDAIGATLLVPGARRFVLVRAVRLLGLRVVGARPGADGPGEGRVIDGDFTDVTPPDEGADDSRPLPPPAGGPGRDAP